MGTKCEPGTTSRASSPDFSSDDDSDDEVPEPSEVCGSIRVDSTSPNLPLIQKKRRASYSGVHRDKESLLEELLAVHHAFQDQKFHLHAHKEHHNAVEEENRSLQFHICRLLFKLEFFDIETVAPC
jgi:hypothetical protein